MAEAGKRNRDRMHCFRETRGPKTESGSYLPSNRGFMDYLTLSTTTHVKARWMLTALTDVASWRRI
ncbi:hypothetical protein DPMN_115814 [Dreissena polymorpha]|uniref:Uncharacterized protein n=1 Tax=Dreissena polymorpha TaxID=45954 RepID=A0A9D4KLW7_DREPO|nr:hypothetical protein DPMN_115814 [Dreissena polymorpha]